MELKDIARGVPDEIWTVFEPILPPVIWCGNGRPPKGNRECFHALLYVLVVWVALVSVGQAELSQSKAPLALVFERLTGASPRTMSAIAVVATLNGIIVQIIMASRVLYGLARQGNLPAAIGAVSKLTHTPLPPSPRRWC